ncbi:outer membrane receptor for ferrienterochelin and colicins [Rhodanobacter fulvus Jip2]|uniref:Outer membrane receptor for ferrienterochelin and colicins n=1 Tax=Rhodanobacter fulvus Jip2 TaxID=1163408 RepID=I4VQP8_9GAMM|nr:TonB-dependent receptor [Rhodanobacter fulvus]EIL89539.1 outer membrane receptor for ferrienterochelin and colicins [Rhodanobacter fulvus Jip2]
MNSRKTSIARQLPRTALAMAVGLGFAGLAFGQATTGSIFGQVPAGSGETVTVRSTSGVTRQVAVDPSGRYDIGSLPLGSYTVTLQRDGTTVDSRSNVTLRVGSGTEVSFGGAEGARNLAAVTVQANALPTIDVTGVDSRTVITAEQLARLPLARSAEAIALLAPGVVSGSGYFTGTAGGSVVSFGGSSVTENAYYINGFNTTDPLSGLGGLTLPYGAIDQQEVLSGGYGAAYGRSDGGVISQVGKRGTNEWHFGAQVQWTPKALKSDKRNYYYGPGPEDGNLLNSNETDKTWTTTESAYAGGPLIQDKLFIFAAVEAERIQGSQVLSSATSKSESYRYDNPKWYAKVDWNITDRNILELTGASSKESFQGKYYDYDNEAKTRGEFSSNDESHKYGSDLYTGKFTSYVTDDLTFTALYGEMKSTYYTEVPGIDPTLIHIYSPVNQNPALNGGTIINNAQVLGRVSNPAHRSKNTNLRLDLSYKLGDHTITAGIDNQKVSDFDDSTIVSGPGYAWEYGTKAVGSYIMGGPVANGAGWESRPWVESNNNGYHVAKYLYQNGSTVTTSQRAQYIEDTWQVTDRWLVKLGLRNDQFINYNGDGVPYLRLTTPQFAPRVGFSWDVNGDSTFKVYGNAGRYYLAMPASVALRSAGSSLYTREYFNYTGIDSNGYPTGLTSIPSSTGGPISANLEYGVPRDPKTAAATNLESEYQDEYILGFDKQLSSEWTVGVKATYRNLRSAIDDVGDSPSILDKMAAMGIDEADVGDIFGSYLFNPGKTNIFKIAKADGSGYYDVPMTMDDFHFNTTLKRKYYGVDLYLEHPFDGKWFGKIDYLYSRSYGNSEGQVRTDIGQEDVSATVDWDYAAVMDYANGELSNSRRHQIKAYGSYQLTPEIMLSGNLAILSGSPKTCLGYYGADESNPGLGYGDYTHFCYGEVWKPGKEHEAWTYTLDLGAEYRPEWAGKKLAFNAMVKNVFDQQKITQSYANAGDSAQPDPSYNSPLYSQTPRYVRFGVSYDF